jgi:hypothetical protein
MDCVCARADEELLRGPPIARGARQQRPVATQPDLIEVSGHLAMAKSYLPPLSGRASLRVR